MIRASEITLTPNDTLALLLEYYTDTHLNPVFESLDSDLATVDTNGIITAQNVGAAEVKVNLVVSEIEQTQTTMVNIVDELEYNLLITRTVTGLTIARKTSELEIGEEFSLQAYALSDITEEHPYPYGYSDDNLVKFISNNEDVCTVKNGVLKGISEGTATITVLDINDTISETFNVTVVKETLLEYTENETWMINVEDYDWSTTETTTLAFIEIVAKAKEDEVKKVTLPNQVYYVSPVYGTINMPSELILDLNGGTIQIEESALTSSGYQMFLFQDTEYSSIENGVIYGERDLIDGNGAESCQAIMFNGYNFKSGLSNCTVSKSPGFNIGANYKKTAIIPFKLTAVENGAIDDEGNDIEEAYAFRHNGYMDIQSLSSRFGFGNMQGYQGYLYLGARCYDIFFYDADETFISCLKNCIQYYLYDKPENATKARIVFRQAEAPTSCDGDYGGIAHLYSIEQPNKCYIKNCVMEDNYSTAIQPNGGESWLFENCYFKNNGYRDPSSHIDWEDGRNHIKGHILRNCTFEGGGTAIMSVNSDGLVVHNNILYDTDMRIGSETQNGRFWLNQFIDSTVSIEPKTDEVFSQNYGYDGSTYVLSVVGGVGFAVREAANYFKEE